MPAARNGTEHRDLCAVRRRIFGDSYDWAGQLRTVAIAKGTWFCLPQYTEPSAAETFRVLRLPRDLFTDRLTCYLGEANAIHPIRSTSTDFSHRRH